jgi:hypothetical protein
MKTRRTPLIALALLLLAQPALAQDRAADSGERFLNSRGSAILSYLHFGSKYQGHRCVARVGVNDAAGRLVPGHFCLRYQFDWDKDGVTTADFLFDDRGRFYVINNFRSNGILNQPFAYANVSIRVLGSVIYEVFRDQLTDNDRQTLRNLIDSADAHGMLHWSLRFQQALNP